MKRDRVDGQEEREREGQEKERDTERRRTQKEKSLARGLNKNQTDAAGELVSDRKEKKAGHMCMHLRELKMDAIPTFFFFKFLFVDSDCKGWQ